MFCSYKRLTKKLQIVSRAGLSFRSNYRLNTLLEQLPTAGPKWRSRIISVKGDIKGPDGEPLVEETELWTRNILEVIQELLENVTYGKDMVFEPREEYSDADRTERCYTEMWTGDWWKRIQVSLQINPASYDLPFSRTYYPLAPLFSPLSSPQTPLTSQT